MITRTRRRLLTLLFATLVFEAAVLWFVFPALRNHSQILRGLTPSFSPAPARAKTIVQAPHEVDEIAFTDNGRLLMAVDKLEGLVTFWEVETGRMVRRWNGDKGYIWCSPDGRRVLQSPYGEEGKDSHLTLRDAVTGRVLLTRKIVGPIRDLTRDFSLVLTWSRDDTFRLMDVASGRVRSTFRCEDQSVDLTSNGRFLLFDGGNRPARILRTHDLTPVLTLPPLKSVRLSSDERQVMGLAQNGDIHRWTLPSQHHEVMRAKWHEARWAHSIDNGSILLGGIEDRPINPSRRIDVLSPDGKRVLHSIVGLASFAGFPRHIAVTGALGRLNDSKGRSRFYYDIIDVPTGRRVARVQQAEDGLGQVLNGGRIYEDNIALTQDARRFATATEDGLIQIFDLQATADNPPDPLVSTDKGRVVTGMSPPLASPDGSTVSQRDWRSDRSTGEGVAELVAEVPSPDGTRTLLMWDRINGNARGYHYTLELRHTATGKRSTLERRGRGHYASMGTPVWSPAGNRVAVGDSDGHVFIWDAISGSMIARLSRTYGNEIKEHDQDAGISLVRFSPDGRHLAAARQDGAIVVYSMTTLLPVAQIGIAEAGLRQMEFAADGKTLYGVTQIVYSANGSALGKDVFAWDVPVTASGDKPLPREASPSRTSPREQRTSGH